MDWFRFSLSVLPSEVSRTLQSFFFFASLLKEPFFEGGKFGTVHDKFLLCTVLFHKYKGVDTCPSIQNVPLSNLPK
jgi:hypothetical protein